MSGAHGVPVRKGYESIPREVLQPEPGVMSARSLGILTHLLSRPEGWRSSAEKLAHTFKEGRVAIQSTLSELEELGYLIRRRVKAPTGRWDWVWIYGDDPAYVAERVDAVLADLRSKGFVSAGQTIRQDPAYGTLYSIAAGQTVRQESVDG